MRSQNRSRSVRDRSHFKRSRYFYLFIYFILFATLITKNIGKEEEKKKKKWRGDLTETIGAY